ncbi:MAG TPA: hypothetical protein VHM92_03475 [Allosphingosinicella sp.]|nr:hypothetical protein [Allosphingosinicella sp.]
MPRPSERSSYPHIAALACLGVTAPAAAQLAPGISGSSSVEYMNSAETWRVVRGFGACFAKENPRAGFALIATEPDTKEEAQVFKKLVGGPNQACLTDTSLRLPVAFFRGSIAEALYKKGTPVPAELIQTPPASGAAVRTLGQAALCFVAAHRAEASGLLIQTLPGSKKELAALQAMSEGFFQCLPVLARNRGFNATQIRYRLAEALLRTPVQSPRPGEPTP